MRLASFFQRLLAGAVIAALPFCVTAFGEEGFDCPAMCETGAKQVLEQCRLNHPGDPAACPSDDGRIPEECRRICAELSGKSLEELQKMLPPNYQDILQGK